LKTMVENCGFVEIVTISQNFLQGAVENNDYHSVLVELKQLFVTNHFVEVEHQFVIVPYFQS
jgi:hypothetical protein